MWHFFSWDDGRNICPNMYRRLCEVAVSSTCNIICFRFFLRRFFPRGADVFLREPTLLLPSSRVFTRNNRAPVYIYLDIYSCANIYFAIPVTHQRTKASFNDQIVELAIMSGRDPRHGPPLWLPSGKHHLGRRRGRCMLRNGAGRCLPGKHKYLILVGKYWPDCASLPSFFNVFFSSKNTGDTLANWFEKF